MSVRETMLSFWPEPSREALDRVREVTPADVEGVLRAAGLELDDVDEIASHWRELQRSPEWSRLLAAGCTAVDANRGDVDAPVAIWPDLDDAGDVGRLFYFYLFALCYDETATFWRACGVPASVVKSTTDILLQHTATHARKRGTLGFDAGWWLVLVLRGELLSIGSLEFHRVNLGVGTLSPEWYPEDDPMTLRPGFRRGDPSLGVHIPQGADLSHTALERTFLDARGVLGRVWPTATRRLATCRSWIMDERLLDALGPESNLVRFQQLFTLVPGWVDGDDDVLEFVFRRPGASLSELPQRTSLERYIVSLLREGDHFHIRTGWLDFDGGTT